MPIYTLLDEKTGRTMDVEGNQPPTPEVIEDLFAKYGEEVKPVQKQVYSPSQVERLAGQATAAGIPDKAVADFIQKSSSEFKQAFPEGFPTQELKAYTPEPVPTGMRSFAEFAGLRPFSGAAELPQQEAADRMRAMQTGLAAERMLPQVMRQATGGDLGTTTPFAQTLTPQEAVETQKETAKKMQEKYGVPEWVTDAATVGGAPLDIAISTGLPLAGSLATRNPQVGGVVASAVANPIVQYRQMLRGERPSFSLGEFGVDVALGAYVPRPVQETEAAINALRGTLDGVGPMTGAQRAAETIITRAGQGTAIGLGGELARQTIDEPSIDVKQVLNVGAISTLFGATFGGLELGAPKVWGKIKDLPLTDALRKLYQEPQTPAVSKAIKEMEEMAARKAAEAPAAATAEAPAAKPVAEVPITAADAKPVAEEPTPAQQLEVLTKRLGQERELLKSYPEMSDTIQDRIAQLEADISSLKTSERAANVPETVDPKNPPAVDQASVEAKRTELEDRVSYLDELLASKEITPDEHVTLVAAAKEEAEKLAAIKFDSPASNPEVNKAAAIIAEANSKQEAALAREGLNIGDQVSEAGILGRDDTLTPRAPATQSSQEQANARLKRIMRGLELDGVPPSAVGVALGRQLADLSVSDPRRFSFLRKQLIDSVNPPRTDAAIPGVTKLKEFEQLTPEMVGVKAEEPITPKKSGVLPGKIPILEGAEPRPVGLGEPPLPTTPRMLELEQPIFDSGQVDQFGNKIWVDQQSRPVDPRVYNEARDRSRYGGAMQQLVFSASGAGGGFVVGWNTGEGLPPEERLQRAINFGLGGMFAPTAIRKIISLQGWANGVLRDRGPGTGALNTADPQILGALAVKGATLVGEGVKNFAEWSRIMVGKFGGEIRPKLREIWAAGEQAKLIPVGAITDAPSPKVTGDKLPGNTAGELLYSDYPKSPVKRTNGEVAELVQDAAITANGKRITSENITPAQERRIVDNGVDEVVAGLKTANHAGEWYTTQVDDGNTVLGVMFPVVRDDGLAKASGRFDTAREARVAAAVAQAATSQNLTVPENGKYTVEQFENLLKNGKFDPSVAKKYGTKGRSIAGNLELANKMVDAVGWSGLDDFIRKDFTVRELTQAIKAATGRDVSISGKMDDVVQGAAIFGPKIGQGFLQNLLGRFDPVTIDLWMRRTWGRWTGDVLAEGIKPEQLGRYVKTLRDAGFELPQSLRGMRITPKGAKKLMIPESLNERLATDPKWKEEIYNHALKVFERWDKDIYPYLKGNMTPKQKEDVLSGKLSIEALADQLRKSDARIDAAWNALPEAGIARPRGKGSKAAFAEGMEASVGRTVDLSNEEISKLKPEWAKSSTVIVNVFEPIDIPSNRDREVITRVVNSIRKKLEDRGIRMTNADIQATLWYPEKDIWAKLAGESESGLKQSYDTVFLKLAEERGLGNQASEALAAARAARAGRGVVAGRTEAVREGTAVAKEAVSKTGLDPKTAGFVSRQLGLSLSGFAGGFTYGMIEARDKPPEQRLTNALLMGAAGGALSPLVLGKALKAINSMPAKPPPATQAVIGSAKPPRTLEDVRRIFDEKPDTPSFAERFRKLPANTITALQNKYYPLAELQKSVLGILPKLNLADRFSLVAGAAGKAEADLIELGRSREALIPDVNSRDLNGYMFLRRAFDRLTTEAKNPEAGSRQVSDFTLPEIQTHLANLRNELGTDKMMRLEKFAEELQKSADADLQLMISSGRMSKQQYDEIKALNEFYAPFYVMEYLSQREGALPGITGAIDTTQPLTKQITGINDKDFKLGDMMTAFGANKLRSYVLAEKNMAMRDLAALVPSDPKGNFIKDLGFAAADISPPKGWETVNYMIDGKVRRLAVSPEVARAVKNMDGQQLNLVSRILSTAATPLRTGATGLNLAFQVVNQFKDLGRLGLMSKYGLRSVSDLVMFPLDVASAAASSWKSNVLGSPDELMMEYLRSGAARSTIASQLSPDTFTRFAQQKDQSAAAKLLGVPVRTIIDTTTKIGNAIEETAKLAGFKRGLRIENLDKLSGTARDEAIQRLAYEVRNYAGSPDFSKHGTIGREMNLLFMFLNARIQGTAADLRRLIGGTGSREGWEAALKLAGGVGTLTTYVWYYNHQPDNIDDYNSRPLTERNNYFLFPRYNKAGEPMYYINEDGEKVREYRRFPKGEIIGLVANITEGALDFFAKKDPSAAVNAGLTVLENLSPISISGRNIDERFESVLSGLNPILKAPIEYTTNRNLFGHRDVVPRKLQQASPELQYRETTAPQFIQAAEAMPDWAPEKMRSPLHLQQLVSNFTGGLLTQFMRPELEGRDPLSSNPVLGRFFSAPYLDKEEDWNEVKKYQTKQTDIAITRERAIDSFIKNSDRMPIGERMEALKQIIVADPERNARALLNNLKDRQAGTTNIDQAVRNLTPNLRAQYLEDRRAKLPDAQSQSQFYMQMYQRGVLTPETVAEIAKLRKLQEESAGKP